VGILKGIISTNKALLDEINKRINDRMYVKIPGYNATQWGDVKKHLKENKYILVIPEDSRNPLEELTSNEKLKLEEFVFSDWYETIKKDEII